VPWVRFDDQFPIHRKVDRLTDAAYRLHTSAIFWCARNLTDGFVSKEDLDGVTARVRTPSRFAAECVRREVWHDARKSCESEKCPAPVDNTYPQGWVIHDYWEYQPSKAQVVRERQASAHRQKKWRENHGDAQSQSNGSSNGVTNAVTNAAPARPVLTNGSVVGQGAGHARARDPANPYRSNDTAAARHPSARSAAEAAAAAGIEPGHRPAADDTIAAIAARARQAINREDGG
jgi:hypothetical protein